MSGGSFDYLYSQEPEQLITGGFGDELERMAEWLSDHNAEDAAIETLGILYSINHIRTRLQVRLSRMTSIWRTVEWIESADMSVEQFPAALAEYRKEIEPQSH